MESDFPIIKHKPDPLTGLPPKRTFGITFQEYVEQRELLREGLICSYGTRGIKIEMFAKYKKFIADIEDVPFNIKTGKMYKFGKPNTLTFIIRNNAEFKAHINEIQKLLDLYGYFIVKTEPYTPDNTLMLYQFEPKYPVCINKESLNGLRLFHITTQSRANKILKMGLWPKESQTDFSHPGNRIYLFATNNPEQYIPAIKKTLGAGRKPDKDGAEQTMVSLEIDMGALDGRDIYLDESMGYKQDAYYAIFTLDCITPSGIKVINF
jgi:hypothetical protein